MLACHVPTSLCDRVVHSNIIANYYVNDLVELAAEYSSHGIYAPALHPAGTCIPQSAVPTAPTTMVPGARVLAPAAVQILQDRYDAMSKFWTEDRLAMFRAIPGVQRIGDSADERGVEIGFYCPPGETCDVAAVREAVLASPDTEEPTLADALAAHGVSGLKVVAEHHRYYANRPPR